MIEYFNVLVTGDREWTDYDSIYDTLQEIKDDAAKDGKLLRVICGAQRKRRMHDREPWRGADWGAIEAAVRLQVPFIGYPARWDYYREALPAGWRRAGTDRNQWMLDENKLHLAVAFHDNLEDSKGTKDMMKRLDRYHVECWLVEHDS